MDELPVETTLFSLSEQPPQPAAERRDVERHLTLFRVGALIVDEQRELCLIKNISAGGMMLRAYCKLAVGKRLLVELKHGHPLAGHVTWVQDEQLGISFDEPVDVLSFLAPSDDGPRPRMPRIETNVYVSVRDGATTYRMRACDISQGGIKVEARSSIAPGAEVVVSLPGLAPQPGVLRWNHEGFTGITFNRLLALPTLVEWLRAQRGVSRAA